MQFNTSTEEDFPEGDMSLAEFTGILEELRQQPTWRSRADKEMDYVDGNQLNSDVLRRQAEIGMPPAVEPLIAPAIDQVLGLEAKNRADWRVEPDNENTDEQLAKGMGFKLNQAERKAKADRACSDAYRTQVCVGIGWVEVSRVSDPFKYPYRCMAIHRNEIWWDWLSKEPDMADARYLVRRKWTDAQQVALAWPNKKELIVKAAGNWAGYDNAMSLDGGAATNLAMAWGEERGWSIEEMEWRQTTTRRVCLFEVWYRRWESVTVLKSPDGRVVEYDKSNMQHIIAVASGKIQPQKATVAKMRRAIFMGPHKLTDGESPYKHNKFPYVPFIGKKEDRTTVPYGLVKAMIFPQDNVNATTSKLRWGLAAVRVERTEGAVAMSDEQFRNEIARADADIKLNQKAMQNGGVFKVERDFQLSSQQWQLLADSRAAINRVSGIRDGLQPSTGMRAMSGVQENAQIEQGTQTLGDINDNFNFARAEVGELLLSLIVEDMIGKNEVINVKGNPLRDDYAVHVNVPMVDELSGQTYMDNDIERAMLKVAINDVPSTSSYRAQQLSAMSEAFKSMPPEFQRVAMPYLVALMDLPTDTRQDVIKAVREAAAAPTQEQIEQQIAEAVKKARTQDSNDLKLHELSLKYSPEALKAELDKRIAETFKTNVEAMYAANQTAATIAMNPAIAPVADAVAQLSGYQSPNPGGVDPNLPTPATVGAAVAPPPEAVVQPGVDPQAGPGGVPANTNPVMPPVPAPLSTPGIGERAGSETLTTADNLPS